MNLSYAKKLSLKVQKTNVRAKKINGFAPKIIEMIIADFQIKDKVSKLRFFQKTFLVTKNKFKIILEMCFL